MPAKMTLESLKLKRDRKKEKLVPLFDKIKILSHDVSCIENEIKILDDKIEFMENSPKKTKKPQEVRF